MRDKEEENTARGMRNIAESNRNRYKSWRRCEFLKEQIEKLNDEIDKSRQILKEDEKHRDLLNDLFHKGIIDEDGNFVD